MYESEFDTEHQGIYEISIPLSQSSVNALPGTNFAEPSYAVLDAFALLRLVPASAAGLEEQVNRRLDVLHKCQTDMERYVFLVDLRATNIMLFDAILKQDEEMASILSELPIIAPELAAIKYGKQP